jgi:nitrogen regulatory protein PII
MVAEWHERCFILRAGRAEMLQLLSAHLESVMEETMDLKGLKFNEVKGSQQMQGTRGVYRGLEYELDLLQKAGVRKVKSMRGIYRGLEYQADFLTAGEAEGFRGIYRGVAYERESLSEEKLEVAPQADQVDPEAEPLVVCSVRRNNLNGKIFLSVRE